MKTCMIKNIEIGKGKPKICLPIVGTTDIDIFEQAYSFEKYHYDMVELRIDYYQDVFNFEAVNKLLKKLRTILSCPIIFTCRTLKEGGEIELSDEKYFQLLKTAMMSQCIDLVDIELMNEYQLLYQLVELAHQHNVKVIMSNHDFTCTPELSVIKERLEKMEILGADILKIAYMPISKKDVVRMLDTTMLMSEKLDKPIVSMSMGELGKITRICGELSGSVITFASAGKVSAPGQIYVEDMECLFEAIHHD